jgi:hypothetical protein
MHMNKIIYHLRSIRMLENKTIHKTDEHNKKSSELIGRLKL